MSAPASSVITTEPAPACPVCAGPGRPKYQGLTDRLFGAPGTWNLSECVAASCGALWLDPRPTEQDIGKAYARYYTHADGPVRRVVTALVRAALREHGAARWGHRSSRLPGPGARVAAALVALYPGLGEHLDLLARYLPAKAMGQGRLLDVGCGDGQALELLADLGWKVAGVELDPAAVAGARARGLDVRTGTLADAGFAEQSFDAVTSSHVLEHVHDPIAFLASCQRVLVPGGWVVAVTPNVDGPGHARHGRDWRGLEPPRHLCLFTRHALLRAAAAAGLRDVQVLETARAVAYVQIASERVRRDGHYEGGWPGLRVWLRAQARQVAQSRRVAQGRAPGDELVLLARR